MSASDPASFSRFTQHFRPHSKEPEVVVERMRRYFGGTSLQMTQVSASPDNKEVLCHNIDGQYSNGNVVHDCGCEISD